MWIAMRVRTSGKVIVSMLGTRLEERNVNFVDDKAGIIGFLPIYKTKKQALANEEKGTPIIQVKEQKE